MSTSARPAQEHCCASVPFVVRGRVVATPLPDRWTVPPNSDRDTRKFIPFNNAAQQSTEPNVLCPGNGPSYFRPQSHRENRTADDDDFLREHQQSRSRRNSSSKETAVKNAVEPCSLTRLDIYVYSDGDDTASAGGGPPASLHLELNRDSSELVFATLQRVLLNLTRKLRPTSKKNKSKMKKQQLAAASKPENPPPTVWIVDDQDNSNHLVEELDIATLTNTELWEKAKTVPLAIQLKIPDDSSGGAATEANASVEDCYTFLVDACPPTITAVQTFEDFRAWLFVHLPVVVHVDTVYASHCRVDWYLNGERSHTTITDAWRNNDRHCYTPSARDVGKELAIVITPIAVATTPDLQDTVSHNGRGCEQAYRFLKKIEPLPENTLLRIRRSWLQENARSAKSLAGDRWLRVVTYNILAHQNAFSMEDGQPYYPYVTSEVLDKDRRLPLILQELLAYQADILCLQEVDEFVFDRLLEPVLTSQQFNYQGYYAGKASDGTREGCAIFWSLDRFYAVDPQDCKTYTIKKLLSQKYSNMDDAWNQPMSDLTTTLDRHPDLQDVVTTKLGHIVQMVPLLPRCSASTELWTVNTHLFYHPQAAHIRLIQMFLLARQLGSELQQRPGECVICGDFNSSLINCAGKLLLDGRVPMNFRDSKTDLNSYKWGKDVQPEDAKPTDDDFPAVKLPESFPKLSSAVEPPPPFTHYVEGFQASIDHVLHSKQLQSISFAPMPTEEDITVQTAMPSVNLPSDHVSLVCDLVMTES